MSGSPSQDSYYYSTFKLECATDGNNVECHDNEEQSEDDWEQCEPHNAGMPQDLTLLDYECFTQCCRNSYPTSKRCDCFTSNYNTDSGSCIDNSCSDSSLENKNLMMQQHKASCAYYDCQVQCKNSARTNQSECKFDCTQNQYTRVDKNVDLQGHDADLSDDSTCPTKIKSRNFLKIACARDKERRSCDRNYKGNEPNEPFERSFVLEKNIQREQRSLCSSHSHKNPQNLRRHSRDAACQTDAKLKRCSVKCQCTQTEPLDLRIPCKILRDHGTQCTPLNISVCTKCLQTLDKETTGGKQKTNMRGSRNRKSNQYNRNTTSSYKSINSTGSNERLRRRSSMTSGRRNEPRIQSRVNEPLPSCDVEDQRYSRRQSQDPRMKSNEFKVKNVESITRHYRRTTLLSEDTDSCKKETFKQKKRMCPSVVDSDSCEDLNKRRIMPIKQRPRESSAQRTYSNQTCGWKYRDDRCRGGKQSGNWLKGERRTTIQKDFPEHSAAAGNGQCSKYVTETYLQLIYMRTRGNSISSYSNHSLFQPNQQRT